MPLSWNEIRSNAFAFSKEWAEESSENAEAKTFWDEFFAVFGVKRRRIASFETRVTNKDGNAGFIDLLWKKTLLVEHKSRGKSLDRAHQQALDYFPGLSQADLPRFLVVSDFARFRIYDLDLNTQQEFLLEDLHENIQLFAFIAGYQTRTIEEQDPVNIKAAEMMGELHDKLNAVGYCGHPLEVFLVRLLYCLFAEDTGIFDRQIFQYYLEDRTLEDGSDLAHHLHTLFYVLNTPHHDRLLNLDEQLADFPYVNGNLFKESLPPASFDRAMRAQLLACCALDWSAISPAVFGSLFQSIMDKKKRRNLGAHYTSEENIIKLIGPLFLDDLHAEFEKVKSNRKRLIVFHEKLRSLTFLDPACGCGNFLVVAYRELRLLELEVLRAWRRNNTEVLNLDMLVRLDVDQFYGIELEEFPAQIAQVSLWLMDHQMNQTVSIEFGHYFARIPLQARANIHCGNALRLDWEDVIPSAKLHYILGNPPFVGAKYMTAPQKADATIALEGVKKSGLLDFVSSWYIKAARMIQGTPIRCAFVSTNSITQGEQVGVLWSWLLGHDITIFFAHRTFAWSSESRGKAAVHCVIIGFAVSESKTKLLFDYDSAKGQAHRSVAENISPYLIDSPNILLSNRRQPICKSPAVGIGNKPIDGGHFLFTNAEMENFIAGEPEAKPYFRRWLGSREFINGGQRWCLWLGECSPNELRKLPKCLERIELVRQYRLSSSSAPTRRIALTPTRFHVENIPSSRYLIVPEVSSERRAYIPLGFQEPETLCSNLVKIVRGASLFHFGILQSKMHMAWTRAVCGRLKSDYRYSVGIVYNNFPWPLNTGKRQLARIEDCAKSVLKTREAYPDSSLADLYDPRSTPASLVRAHNDLDKAVDLAYGRRKFETESERVSFLFDLYQTYENPLTDGSTT